MSPKGAASFSSTRSYYNAIRSKGSHHTHSDPCRVSCNSHTLELPHHRIDRKQTLGFSTRCRRHYNYVSVVPMINTTSKLGLPSNALLKIYPARFENRENRQTAGSPTASNTPRQQRGTGIWPIEAPVGSLRARSQGPKRPRAVNLGAGLAIRAT